MKKILIVDDDHHIRLLVSTVFKREGFATFDAIDGHHALSEFHIIQPDVVIMDHNMPIMSGIDALREIRRTNSSVPIVMMSAVDDPSIVEEALRYGAHQFISKPTDIEQIVSAVQRALGTLITPVIPSDVNG